MELRYYVNFTDSTRLMNIHINLLHNVGQLVITTKYWADTRTAIKRFPTVVVSNQITKISILMLLRIMVILSLNPILPRLADTLRETIKQ